MPDPRERIKSGPLGCERLPWQPAGVREWVVGEQCGGHSGRADWPEVVAFARAILAADAEWRERNAPTLEELRARYPNRRFGIKREPCGPTFCDVAFYEYMGGTHYAPHYTERAALEWLAAKLAEGGADGT